MLRNGKIVLGAFALAVLLSSCSALKKLPASDNNNDVYLDPKKDRSYFYKVEEPKPVETVASAQNTAPQDTSNNPYYKDKDFNYDDYYDNQYASRIRRFHSPYSGMSYYDSYYTNSYFYNNNPYQYGVSIYNGYSFWGPSYNNYMYVPSYNWGGYYGYGTNYGYNSYYGSGMSIGMGYSSGYYNNWCNPYSYGYYPYYGYNSFYNPYYSPYGYGYSPYYGGGYGYNPYGYYNGYDYNSYTYYGPRVSHSGGNSKQVINPGMHDMKLMNPGSATASSSGSSAPAVVPKGIAPTDIKRFDQVVVPSKQTYSLDQNSGSNNPQVIHTMNPGNNGGNGSMPQPVKGKSGNDQIVIHPSNSDNGSNTSSPKPKQGAFDNGQPLNGSNNNAATNTSSGNEPKPKRGWFSNDGPVNSNNGGSTPSSSAGNDPKPTKSKWFNNSGSLDNNNSGNNNNSNNNVIRPSSSGSSWPSSGGGGGGGSIHHSGGGGGGFRPR